MKLEAFKQQRARERGRDQSGEHDVNIVNNVVNIVNKHVNIFLVRVRG